MKNPGIKPKTIFLTGATGLVGSYMLKILLKNGHKVFVLAQNKDGKSAKERVKEVVCFWDKNVYKKRYRKLIVLEGNIVKKNLGLDRKTVNILRSEVEEVFHSAANTKFNLPLEEARKINVEGTENVLKLAYDWNKKGKLLKVNHISTAYVCGDHKGVFSEKDLDVGQKFLNTYTQSKFEAEKVVQNYRNKGLWVDIFRPPLVVGESRTGKTTTFNQGVYQMFHLLNQKIFNYFPGKGIFLNLVFVDDLCKSIYLLSFFNSLNNKNFHVFNVKKESLENILKHFFKKLGISNIKIVTINKFLLKGMTLVQKKLLSNNILAIKGNSRLNSFMTNFILEKYRFYFQFLTKNEISKMIDVMLAEGKFKNERFK